MVCAKRQTCPISFGLATLFFLNELDHNLDQIGIALEVRCLKEAFFVGLPLGRTEVGKPDAARKAADHGCQIVIGTHSKRPVQKVIPLASSAWRKVSQRFDVRISLMSSLAQFDTLAHDQAFNDRPLQARSSHHVLAPLNRLYRPRFANGNLVQCGNDCFGASLPRIRKRYSVGRTKPSPGLLHNSLRKIDLRG